MKEDILYVTFSNINRYNVKQSLVENLLCNKGTCLYISGMAMLYSWLFQQISVLHKSVYPALQAQHTSKQ